MLFYYRFIFYIKSNLIKNFTYFEHSTLLISFMFYYIQNYFFILIILKFPNQLKLKLNLIFNTLFFYYMYNQKNAYPNIKYICTFLLNLC